MNLKYKHILWDWNGTLLDDVDLCIAVTNKLMKRRKKNFSIDRQQYLQEFTFPVVDFYRKMGFDFSQESFSEMAEEWIAEYKRLFKESVSLNGAVIDVLTNLKKQGYKQSILSACENTLLNESIEAFGLQKFFHKIHGTHSNEAHGKVDLALTIIEAQHCSPQEALLIGDTTHDYEVAQAAGLQCVLVANGHQHSTRLKETSAPVICDISGIPNFLESLK